MTYQEIINLRIGNIMLGEISLEDEKTGEEIIEYHPCVIEGIDENRKICLEGTDESLYDIIWLDDCDDEICGDLHPMPLTEEVLAAVGFEDFGVNMVIDRSAGSVFSEDHKSTYVQLLKYDMDGNLKVFNLAYLEEDIVKMRDFKIKYVHELQDLLSLTIFRDVVGKFRQAISSLDIYR